MKKVNVFGLLMAVALVSLCSSWLNGVVVNATTAASTAFTQVSEMFDGLVAPKLDQQIPVQETPDQETRDHITPLAGSPDETAVETEDGSKAFAAYLADLESTQSELIESVSKLQAEIELLKRTANMSASLSDEKLEGDEPDEDAEDTDTEYDEGDEAKSEPERASRQLAPATPAAESENAAPAHAELTAAQIWQQDYRNYQEWAKQYEVME